jgi:hypothetical protein
MTDLAHRDAMPLIQLDGLPVTLTAVSLEITGELRFNHFRRLVEQVGASHEASIWWRADLAAFGDRQYRRDYGPALEELYARQTIYQLAWVSRSVEISRRREILSFGHHQEVASLDPEIQTVWLDDAIRQNWTRDELRAHIADWKGRKTPTPALTFKAIGEIYDLCVRAAEKLGVDAGEFARQALEEKARQVLEA